MRPLIILLLLNVSGALQAAPVQWALSNVSFLDGATATGSFYYDGDNDTAENNFGYSGFDIIVAGGTTPAIHYTQSLFAVPNYFVTLAGPNGGRLQLDFDLGYNTEGQTGPASPAFLWFGGSCAPGDIPHYCTDRGSFQLLGPQGNQVLNGVVEGSSITAVPIPAAVWLFGSALAGLGWIRRKQTT